MNLIIVNLLTPFKVRGSALPLSSYQSKELGGEYELEMDGERDVHISRKGEYVGTVARANVAGYIKADTKAKK